MESWDGKLQISSELGKGTTIQILLPKASPPRWFSAFLTLKRNARVVILDDDSSIHSLWDMKLPGIEVIHHYSPVEFLSGYRAHLGDSLPVIYLCDYELRGHRETGLDLIEMCGITSDSVLVTSRWDDLLLREKCLRTGVQILPKILVAHVPIQILGK